MALPTPRPPTVNGHKYLVALCQLPVSSDKYENIARACARIDAAAAAGAKLVVLPEIWNYAGQVFNTCCVIGPDGGIMAKHRKLHLFEIDIPGDITLRECDTFTPGAHPSALNMSTGELLWDLMQKSRAVDSQLFVATCSPAKADYMIWGHSSLIGPFGEMLAAAGHEEATVIGEVSLSMTQSTSIPLEAQSRCELYRLVDLRRDSGRSDAA